MKLLVVLLILGSLIYAFPDVAGVIIVGGIFLLACKILGITGKES